MGSYTVDTDMDGQSRPSGSAKGVGADEVSAEMITSRPLTRSDVGGVIGPSWFESLF